MEQADQNGMLYTVEAALAGVISHYYHIYNTDNYSVIKHLSPNLEIMMIFNLGTPCRVSFGNTHPGQQIKPSCIVIGPLRNMLNYELGPGADAIVVNFKLNGFYRLFKVPANSLEGEAIYDPDVLTDKYNFEDLRKDMSRFTDIKSKLRLISEYVAAFVDDNDNAVGPLLSGEHHFYNPAIEPVKAIAAETQLTKRTIQLRFQKYAGYSPKELLRFLRFKMVVEQLMKEEENDIDIFGIILDFGYFDQSHLTKDFQHFLGITPQNFIKNLKGKEFFITGHGPKSQDQIP